MKPETTEWVGKAEGDLAVARREMATAEPVYHVICFLAQQCAEKYLKAVLEENCIPFTKTHDLVLLHDLNGGLLPDLDSWRGRMATFGPFGIAVRYPFTHAEKQEAEDSMAVAEAVRAAVRKKLSLPEGNEQGVTA
ncbi:MAG: HEPN domain-containing protein [Planctomycetes bacterium]|nr:HEPN domain-containing protein [Planctomycetota bacterium]